MMRTANCDDEDHYSITSSATSSNSPNSARWDTAQDEPRVNVASKEQRRVSASFWTMVLVLICVATALSTATYLLFQKGEEDDFRRTFKGYVSEIRAVSKQNVATTFLVIEAFSNSITAQAKSSGQTWPNVTIRDYTSQGIRMGALAGEGQLVLAPIVTFEERLGFEEYARGHVYAHVQENLDYRGIDAKATDFDGIHQSIKKFVNRSVFVDEPYEGPDVRNEYVLNWQQTDFQTDGSPIFILNNYLANPTVASDITFANITKKAKVGFFDGRSGITAQIVQPIFQDIFPEFQADMREVKAFLWMSLDWDGFFANILPENANGTCLVMESTCGFSATYHINGLSADLIGIGDFHDPKYEHMEISSDFFRLGSATDELPPDLCADQLTIRLYPTDALKETTTTNKPILFAVAVAGIFIFTSVVFFGYDFAVRRRQRKVMSRVITQDKIVSNLFPPTIRDRLYGIGDRMNGASDSHSTSTGNSAKDLLDLNEVHSPGVYGARPIADLFLETTVLYADIAGFTAWSSAREPSQVFILLENVYGAFDKLSHRHGVFKVETIGDCYVAVTGLPLPTKEHAVVMAKFARDCVTKMEVVTSKMEIDLGPDTGDLGIRIGIHSGQVTAGVLRGERSRFQLFGDTVNVASRIESTGESGRIHLSGVTAELLKAQGRGKWVRARGDILVRGKGTMFTYWLETKAESEARHHSSQIDHAKQLMSERPRDLSQNNEDNSEVDLNFSDDEDELFESGFGLTKKQRLVEWNVEILSGLLKRIVAARTKKSKSLLNAEMALAKGRTVLEEFEEIITLPKVTMDELNLRKDPDAIMLDEKVIGQLRTLLSHVADLYRDNAFHSFEHASHVTASVAKLLSRIVTSDTTQQTKGPDDLDSTDLAGHSYGITSDPLTQFAVVFSAIIHDADHPGVPNIQLVKENDPWVSKYKGKSLAEQNSVDLVWALLLQPDYADLRACIYCDEVELKRFRQLLVNVVMATDIADKELGALRKARWTKAFDPEQTQRDPADLVINRKATIVLEHLIQASDVSHTMQHWQVYKKWNQKFFNECYSAWTEGRAGTDPSVGWYEGEIGFFEFYIIPLAKKLDSCGVFGVSSHEYLNYAISNLEEWKKTGKEVVKEFVKAYNSQK